MNKAIMLCKTFVGSWGDSSSENIPHEIINRFKTDRGEQYLYIPPYGGFDTDKYDVEYVLFTGPTKIKDGTFEILYLAKGLELLHNGGNSASSKKGKNENEKLLQLIKDREIQYGGVALDQIPMSIDDDVDKAKTFYLTFRVQEILEPNLKPGQKLYFTCDAEKRNESEQNESEQNEYRILSRKTGQQKDGIPKDFVYQRQRGYFISPDSPDSTDSNYDTVKSIIENEPWLWKPMQPITIKPGETLKKEQTQNILQLIGKEYDETSYTNMFYHFFQSDVFLRFRNEVLDVSIPDDEYRIEKEKTVSVEIEGRQKPCRMDLFIEGANSVFVLENKIKSGINGIDKHGNLSQLSMYVKYVHAHYPDHNKKFFIFEPDYNDIEISKFDDSEEAKKFKPIKYSEIERFFRRNSKDVKSKLQGNPYLQFFDLFVDSLHQHTLTKEEDIKRRFLLAINSLKN